MTFQTYTALVTYLNATLGGSLSGEYSLPKVKGKFKGDHTPQFHTSKNVSLPSGMSGSALTPQEQESQSVGSDEGGGVFSGTPFAVLKVRDCSVNSKVFVNVCVQDSLGCQHVVIGEECPRTATDKKGDTSTTYDVCVHTDMLETAAEQGNVSLL